LELKCFAESVRTHHERLDGSGYPERLAGAAIPAVTRIVSVADAFAATIERRPYQAAMLPADALLALEAGSGTLWDSRVVAALRIAHSTLSRSRPTLVRPSPRPDQPSRLGD
jgi:HD-GYP domain-containing protein (c-di-GMP phosphodiesterase class II)